MKKLSCVVLVLSAAAFVADFFGFDVLADFAALSRFDAPIWAAVLLGLAYLQWRLSGSCCPKCQLWSNFVLQLSGLALLIIGTAFAAEYPPFSWAMGVFPILGLLFVFVGRIWANVARNALTAKGCRHGV